MERTVCELFAGVGGFRCGLNNINENVVYSPENNAKEKWKTVWYNQWEPAEKSTCDLFRQKWRRYNKCGY